MKKQETQKLRNKTQNKKNQRLGSADNNNYCKSALHDSRFHCVNWHWQDFLDQLINITPSVPINSYEYHQDRRKALAGKVKIP